MTKQATAPERELRIAGVSASIWRSSVSRNGREIDRFSIKLRKRYRNPDTGEWKSSEMYVFPSDLPALLIVAQRAYEHCKLRDTNEETDHSR